MSRDFSTDVQTAIAKQQTNWIWIIHFILPTTDLYFANYDRDIYWDSHRWRARYWRFDQITQSLNSVMGRTTITLDDTDGYLFEKFGIINPQGKDVLIYRVFQDLLSDSDNYIHEFTGILGQPRFEKNFCMIDATSGPPMSVVYPLHSFGRRCQHDFGNRQCNHDDYADISSTSDIWGGLKKMKITGTATGASTTSILYNANLTQEDDCWKHGILEVTDANGIKHWRTIGGSDKSAASITTESPMPVSMASLAFEAVAGCSKIWECCGKYIKKWRPDDSNLAVTAVDGGSPKKKFKDENLETPKYDAIEIYGTTSDADTIKVEVDATKVRLVVTGGANPGTDDLDFATYTTLGTMITAMNGLATRTYSAVLCTEADSSNQSSDLKTLSSVNIRGWRNKRCLKANMDFAGWHCIFETGNNANETGVISDWDSSGEWITLTDNLTNNIEVGDEFTLRKWWFGPKYPNLKNYLGFKHMPRSVGALK